MSLVAKKVFENDDLRRYIFAFYNDFQKPKLKCFTKIKIFFNVCFMYIEYQLFICFFFIRAPVLTRL